MVKIASIFMAALAAIAPVAEAGDCTQGLNYCGKTLLTYGDYEQRIVNAMGPNPPVGFQIKERSLFHCLSGGAIQYLRTCGWFCVDGGAGQNDGCNP
ncbi:hypothetical protein E4U55_006609 [Claviceps digitariae]|nr:hypothetical protein E4U55_006609 [Claviceps digitariae]